MKQMKAEMFLFPALLSATAILMVLPTQVVSASDSGAGLGLYISKKIVDMHGGKFWAQNNRGAKGATFTFTLPVNDKTL